MTSPRARRFSRHRTSLVFHDLLVEAVERVEGFGGRMEGIVADGVEVARWVRPTYVIGIGF